MQLKEDKGNILIENAVHFDIDHIFYSGQIFRFEKSTDNIFTTAAYGRILKIGQKENQVTFYNVTMQEFERQWFHFFALDENYDEIIRAVNTDEIMLRALEYGRGIRILKQDLWEMMISFIVSQNNNIPRIKKIIQTLCENFGSKIVEGNDIQFAFPTIAQLENITQDEFKEIGLGYRDSYIADAVCKVGWGEIDLEMIKKMDTMQARAELMKIKGVGGKVADCILLFGLSRYEVCPHDVWVKRIFSEKYGVEKICEKTGYEFARKKWGKYAGIAQQYLFYCERENYKKQAIEKSEPQIL